MIGLGKPKLCTKLEVASFSHCVNIEGEPPNFGNSPAQGHAHPFFCVWFYDGPWQTPAARQIWSRLPQPLQKYYRGTRKILGSSPSQGHPIFFSGCDFMMGLGKPKPCTKFEIASFSQFRNIKGKPQISGSSPNPGPHPLFLLVIFDDGPWQTPVACQIWSRWLHLLRKYKKICF